MSVTSSVLHIPAQADADTAIRSGIAPAGQEADAGAEPFKDLLTQRKRAVDDAADTGDTDPIIADHSALGILQAFIQQDATQTDPTDGAEENAVDTDALLRVDDKTEGRSKDTGTHVKATPQDMLELAAQRTSLERATPDAGKTAPQDAQALSSLTVAATPALRNTTDAAASAQAIARPELASATPRSALAGSQAQQRIERAQQQSGSFQAVDSVQTSMQQAIQNRSLTPAADLVAADTQAQQHNAPLTGTIQSTGLPHAVVQAAAHDQVQATVGSRAWASELGQQVARLGNQAIRLGTQHAELRLDPPDLGPLRITLSLQDGIAQASFVSPHLAVRQAVESALPQLQQALNQAGIALGEANVGDHTAQQRQEEQFAAEQRQGNDAAGTLADSDTSGQGLVSAVAQSRRPDALIDVFV